MSIQPILVRRRLAGAPAAPPASGGATRAGEVYFNGPGFLANGPNSLWIDNGTALVSLVDNTRQVELTGAQTITGVKTVSGAGAVAIAGVANLTFGDGVAGQILTKGAGAAITWGAAPLATVITDGLTITGDGLAATPIALLPSVFGAGLTWAPNAATVNVATAAEIATGTLPTAFITPLGLRGENGAAASALVTTVKTIVPAINEIFNAITQLVGVVIFAGTYDATAPGTGTYNGQAGIAAGTGVLPAASAANHGAYLITTVAGPGGPPAPAGAIGVGDWLLSDGAAWIKMPFSQAPLTAANIGVVPAVAGGSNVQDALEGLETAINTAAFYDATTFGGDALTALTQLTLTVVDGGTF